MKEPLGKSGKAVLTQTDGRERSRDQASQLFCGPVGHSKSAKPVIAMSGF